MVRRLSEELACRMSADPAAAQSIAGAVALGGGVEPALPPWMKDSRWGVAAAWTPYQMLHGQLWCCWQEWCVGSVCTRNHYPALSGIRATGFANQQQRSSNNEAGVVVVNCCQVPQSSVVGL